MCGRRVCQGLLQGGLGGAADGPGLHNELGGSGSGLVRPQPVWRPGLAGGLHQSDRVRRLDTVQVATLEDLKKIIKVTNVKLKILLF